MSEESATAVASAAPTPKKKAKSNATKKVKTAPSHPKVSEMVTSAITNLKERGGSSLQAIKKYIGAHYKVDMDRLVPFIKKYLRSAVANGSLVQTKGKGATGSFKLSVSGQKSKEPGKNIKRSAKKESGSTPAKKKKPAVTKKVTKPKIKAADKPKKKAAKKSGSPAKKTASKPKSTKKTAKPSKPKAPKAKKMKATTPKKSAKKTPKK